MINGGDEPAVVDVQNFIDRMGPAQAKRHIEWALERQWAWNRPQNGFDGPAVAIQFV
jgi:hypothetical protein